MPIGAGERPRIVVAKVPASRAADYFPKDSAASGDTSSKARVLAKSIPDDVIQGPIEKPPPSVLRARHTAVWTDQHITGSTLLDISDSRLGPHHRILTISPWSMAVVGHSEGVEVATDSSGNLQLDILPGHSTARLEWIQPTELVGDELQARMRLPDLDVSSIQIQVPENRCPVIDRHQAPVPTRANPADGLQWLFHGVRGQVFLRLPAASEAGSGCTGFGPHERDDPTRL